MYPSLSSRLSAPLDLGQLVSGAELYQMFHLPFFTVENLVWGAARLAMAKHSIRVIIVFSLPKGNLARCSSLQVVGAIIAAIWCSPGNSKAAKDDGERGGGLHLGGTELRKATMRHGIWRVV